MLDSSARWIVAAVSLITVLVIGFILWFALGPGDRQCRELKTLAHEGNRIAQVEYVKRGCS